MEQKYRLKKEARQFFKKELHTETDTLDWWEKNNIHINLLEQCEKAFIEYGHKKEEKDITFLSAHDTGTRIGHFKFTVNVLDLTLEEYANINIAELMERLQETSNNFFKQ